MLRGGEFPPRFLKVGLLRAQRQLRAVLWTVFEAIGLFSGFLKISRGFSDSGPFYERCMVTSEILSEISVSKCQFPMPEWLDLVVKPCRKVFLVVPTNHKQNNSIKSIKTPTGIDVFHDFVSLVRMAETSSFNFDRCQPSTVYSAATPRRHLSSSEVSHRVPHNSAPNQPL